MKPLRQAGTGAQAFAATMVPAVVSISYVNYAIVAILGGIMAMNGTTDIGSLASYLVFVRQAAAPINQFTQQSNFLLAALPARNESLKQWTSPQKSTMDRSIWWRRLTQGRAVKGGPGRRLTGPMSPCGEMCGLIRWISAMTPAIRC